MFRSKPSSVRTQLRFAAAAAVPALLTTIAAHADTHRWTGLLGTDWDEPLNWLPAEVPASTDDLMLEEDAANPSVLWLFADDGVRTARSLWVVDDDDGFCVLGCNLTAQVVGFPNESGHPKLNLLDDLRVWAWALGNLGTNVVDARFSRLDITCDGLDVLAEETGEVVLSFDDSVLRFRRELETVRLTTGDISDVTLVTFTDSTLEPILPDQTIEMFVDSGSIIQALGEVVFDRARLELEGPLFFGGSLSVGAISGGATITSTGELRLTGGTGTVENEFEGDILGSGPLIVDLGFGERQILSGPGNQLAAGILVRGGELGVFSETPLGAGRLTLEDGGTLVAEALVTIVTDHDIDLAGGLSGLLAEPGRTLEIASTMTGPGDLRIDGGSRIILSRANEHSGDTIVVNDTTLEVSNAVGFANGTGRVVLQSGAIAGTGRVLGPLDVELGTAMVPAAPAGIGPTRLDVVGDLTFRSGSRLEVSLGGASTATGPRVTGGTLTIEDGVELVVTPNPSVDPQPGDEWVIAIASDVEGTFDQITSGLDDWSVIVGGGGIRLRYEDGCAADVDGDDTVGFSDLVAVLADFGTRCSDCHTDVDGDGIVDFDDLLEVIASWGAGCGE